ncbi:PHA-granule associated protein 4 [Cupriavidus necator]|uniref:PHA-granule associated protein 4 n=1 Tax=Cupriavidus necator TaxID=106590 RepID=UPI00339D4890
MSVYVARSRASAIEHINSRADSTVDLDYETAWEDALELGRLGQRCGIVVQFRTVEHVSVVSADALARGLREKKQTFRQRYLYCQFDITALSEDCLCELEALAIGHGDYILPGHRLEEATLIWE